MFKSSLLAQNKNCQAILPGKEQPLESGQKLLIYINLPKQLGIYSGVDAMNWQHINITYVYCILYIVYLSFKAREVASSREYELNQSATERSCQRHHMPE